VTNWCEDCGLWHEPTEECVMKNNDRPRGKYRYSRRTKVVDDTGPTDASIETMFRILLPQIEAGRSTGI
jgi:hypothetical protein